MRNLSNNFNHFCFDSLYLFNHFLSHQFLSYHLYFLYFSYHICNLLDDLNLFWNLLDSFFNLNHRHYLFNNPVNNFIFDLDMMFNFLCISVLNNWNYLLYHFLYFNNFWNLYYFLNNSFNKHRNFDNFLNNFFYWHYFFIKNLNSLNFSLNMIYYLFNFNRSFNLYQFFLDYFYLLNSWYLLLKLNYLFNYSWYFNYSFNFLFIWY